MDLVALTLLSFSLFALFGAILAGFIFAPWVMAFGALGLLALLPRINYGESAAQPRSTLTQNNPGKGSAPQGNRPAAPLSSSEQGSNQTADLPLTMLQYRGNFYRSAVSSKTAALEEKSTRDR